MAFIQKNRSIIIKTPLPDDVLLFRSMSGREELGSLFQFELDLLSEDFGIKLDDVLGQSMTVQLNLPDGEFRYFNGVVSRFCQVEPFGEFASYQATLRPWFWFLTRTSDCRIFQNKTVPDIIKEVFRDNGFSDFKESLSGAYREWEYCVQYRETDFNFISRLMEQEGIYYFFTHEDGKHTLQLSDSISAHGSIAEPDVPYFPPSENVERDLDFIHSWSISHDLQPGAYAHRDFDFKNPKANLEAKLSNPFPHDKSDYEVYDYPGEYLTSDEGNNYVRTRLEELHAQYERVRGDGNVRTLYTGGLFNLTGYPREDQNREYLVVSATYDLRGSVGTGGGEEEVYSCSFEAISSQQPFRSPRNTPKPVVQGPQTAIVVGPSGEEIWTDEFGRVKVQFHWDRYSENDENSSCWIRVSHPWAGKAWGGIALPRIDQEVVISFIEGDPDRPILTGRVYNADNMPPYELPANATQSGVKSRSSKGGTGENFNEICFEDKKDEEQLFIHAEKDMEIHVKNDRLETVVHDRELVVENDKREHVKNERHETVESNHTETIGADRNLKVEGKEAKEVGDTLSLKVSGDVTEKFDAKHSETVSGDYKLKASNIVIEGTSNVTLKVGQSSISIESGGIKIGTTGTIELEAASSVTVKGTAGVTVESSATLDVKGTAGVTVESPATVDVKGTSTTVKGDAMLTLQGGLVKIN